MISQKFAVLVRKERAIGAFSQFRIVNLINDSVKILGCHHSYNSQLANDRNFCDTIKKILSVLNLWQTRDLSLLGRLQIFKTIGFSIRSYTLHQWLMYYLES